MIVDSCCCKAMVKKTQDIIYKLDNLGDVLYQAKERRFKNASVVNSRFYTY